MLVDGIKELLDPSTLLWGLHDSGAYQDIEPYDRWTGGLHLGLGL